jgi:adenylate cyclase, class 2
VRADAKQLVLFCNVPRGDVAALRQAFDVVLSGPDQASAANTLLDVLGMVRLCQVEKTRTTFLHPDRDDVTVVIDLITGVGAFAETEVMAADPDAAATLLDVVERQLGLADCAVVRLPYRDLVLQHEQVNVTV